MTNIFEETHKACLESVAKDGLVPYYLRARIDEAAKTIVDRQGLSSHGRFHFYFGVLLFLKCAERTFPIWEEAVPESDLKTFKTLIMQGMENTVESKTIKEFHDRSESDFQTRIYDWDERMIDRAGAAGPSCLTSLSMYLGHFNFATNVKNEQNIDIYYWDSAFYSSVAVAGGAEWQSGEKSLDVEARANFWKWYVDEAIPQSRDEASELLIRNS